MKPARSATYWLLYVIGLLARLPPYSRYDLYRFWCDTNSEDGGWSLVQHTPRFGGSHPGAVGAFPDKSEQLILHCCSIWFLLAKTSPFVVNELSYWQLNGYEPR